MTTTCGQETRQAHGRLLRCVLGIAVALCAAPWAATAFARGDHDGGKPRGRFCSATALAQFVACENEARDDSSRAQAICTNLSDAEERGDCLEAAKTESRAARQLCREQRAARSDLCAALGEQRYDPSFDPADFDSDFTSLTQPNPYFPLGIGSRWAYVGGDETVTVEVLERTKRIEGVTCIAVNDRVEREGQLVEDTDDWYGQRRDGTVDYCGELARDFETFEGDDPEAPELVDIGGSWKAGRDGAKPGTIFLASPAPGAVYRQEWAPGDAEDAARVLSTSYGLGADPELDELVPGELAELLCAARDCVVTGEITPLEPGAFARKYYAAGIGLFLEVNPETEEVVRLVDCNVDPRCADLPAP